MSAWQRQLEDLRREAARDLRRWHGEPQKLPPGPPGRIVRGWQFLLSLNEEAPEVASWHLSAMLWPRGRGSTDEDWHFLGEAVRILGAPRDPLGGEAAFKRHPNAPIHWHWPAEPAVAVI